MIIQLHRHFQKQLEKLPKNLREKTKEALAKFENDPHDPLLHNHALKGPMRGKRAFSAAPDLRIIFEEFDGCTLVIMLKIGTHEQVY